jgi:protein-S-isoprenylcysteine O-methyltransferase Ste14
VGNESGDPHTGGVKRSTIGWVLVVLQFVLLLLLLLLPRRAPTVGSLVIGVALGVAAVVLAMSASRTLGRGLTPTPVPISGAGLRTDGAYRYVRHPIYSAVLLLVLGFVVAVGSLWTALGGLVILAFFWAKSRWEDRLLHAEYGDEWAAWAARTGAIIPRRLPSSG